MKWLQLVVELVGLWCASAEMPLRGSPPPKRMALLNSLSPGARAMFEEYEQEKNQVFSHRLAMKDQERRLSTAGGWACTRNLTIRRVSPLSWETLRTWDRPEGTRAMWNRRLGGFSTNFSGFPMKKNATRPYQGNVRLRFANSIFGGAGFQAAHLIPHNAACRYIMFAVVSFMACWADPRKVANFLTINSIAGEEQGLMMESYNYIPILSQRYWDENPLFVILPILPIEEQLNFNITRHDNTYRALVIGYNAEVFETMGAASAKLSSDLLDTDIPAQRHQVSVALNGHVAASRLVASLLLERDRHPDNRDGCLTDAEMSSLTRTRIANKYQGVLDGMSTSGIPVFDPAVIPDHCHFRVVTFSGPHIPHPFLLQVKNLNALTNLDDVLVTGPYDDGTVLNRSAQKASPSCRDQGTAEICGFCFDELVHEGLAEREDGPFEEELAGRAENPGFASLRSLAEH